MEKYFKRKATEQSSTLNPQTPNERRSPKLDPPRKKRFLQFELEKLPNDPGLRPKMSYYHPSDRDEIIRYYLQNGPCQPKEITFAQRKYGDTFQHKGCGDAFITEDFTNWKKSESLENCRGNLKLTSPDIQKDIVKAAATVTTQVILDDLGDDLFAILIDESRDISVKEQMVVVTRYVNNEGKVIERFLGVVHVSNTSALTLKSGFESLLAKYGLSLSRICGKDYDEQVICRVNTMV
ncbi:hypothetical protein KIW84_065405 [Lathyrus oleraceus]|uniref:DUF4371 domain-containing protein n=1 Tax=Pisum sativum TaxID=3888 RepID=A0A9D5ACF4_PEA|nr:hypothetical protein KIW84_065405 [Pisum sativum]